MTNNTLTDTALLKQLGERLAQLRLSQNMTQQQLAEQAGLGLRTVQRLELGEAATQLSGFVRVCRALGIVDRFDALLPPQTVSPIAQVRLKKRQRSRATGSKAAARKRQPWTWNDKP